MYRFLVLSFLLLLILLTALLASLLFYPVQTYNTLHPYLFEQGRDLKFQSFTVSKISIPTLLVSGSSKERTYQGTVSASIAPESGAIDLDIKDASYAQSGILLEGMSADGQIRTSPELHSKKPLKIRAKSITAGVVLSEASADLSFVPKTVYPNLKNLTASAFGGTITLRDLTIAKDTGKPKNISVTLKEIDLSRLVSLLGQQGLRITGRISGTIPIQFTRTGMAVSQGHIKAQEEGGIIEYYDDGMSSGLTALVRKALSNYHYRSLEADVTYSPDGQMVIAAQLKGSNPDLNKGQEVHVNLNVEQNILSLLRSLRAKQNIEERVEKAFGKNTNE